MQHSMARAIGAVLKRVPEPLQRAGLCRWQRLWRSAGVSLLVGALTWPGPGQVHAAPAPALAPQVVYHTDFEGPVGPEWSTRATDVTPIGGRRFLGQFGSEAASLSLANLPAHTDASVSFDLFVIRSWDGNFPGGVGPDVFDLHVAGGPTLLHTTFNNVPQVGNDHTQNYPDMGTEGYPDGPHLGQTGAAEKNTLGFVFGGLGVTDAVYKLNFKFPHTAGSLQLDFVASLVDFDFSQDIRENESWGIDNVTVSIAAADATPPTTKATVSPSPNGNGWNTSDVKATLTATDNPGGSGVKSLTFSATGVQPIASTTVPGATAKVPPITVEGVTTLSFFATDQAGNTEAPKTLVVKIDKTPPEATVRFDPAHQDLVVLGQDALSGVPTGPITPSAVTRSGTAQLRTYTLRDRADNTLVLNVQVRKEEQRLTASVVSLQYNGGAVQPAADNRLRFEAERDDGRLQDLEQRVEVRAQASRQRAEAQFEAEHNQTRIEVQASTGEQQLTRPGLVLLELVTNKGALQVTF